MRQKNTDKTDKIDKIDKSVIYLLSRDGRMSAGKIAERLEISQPTVRSRIEALTHSGVLRIAGLIDAFKAKDFVTAIVGIRLVMHKQLDQKIEQISNLNQVHWAAGVTGRYDIIVEVVLPNGMPGLYEFLTKDLPRLGDIQSSESFVVMKAKRKWILLPAAAENW
jgi:Lrp/AsnC family transcriptional regulator for asnA, asnC and gidA